MKHARLAVLAVVLATLLPRPAAGFESLTGIFRGVGPDPTCDEPLGPDRGELFAFAGTDASRRGLLYLVNASYSSRLVAWDVRTGAWQLMTGNFPDVPGLDFVVLATHYRQDAADPTHQGYLGADTSHGAGFLGYNRIQPIPAPTVTTFGADNELTWPPLVASGTDGACHFGGDPTVAVVLGYDVYRLRTPSGFTTPDQFLCGLDGDCRTTADNGFLAFVPHAPSGIDGLIHFTDMTVGGTPDAFVYAIQPVAWGAPVGDANGDTIADEDVDGDTIPEFVDPSGTGRGLTGRVPSGAVGFVKPILIGPDARASSSPDMDSDGVPDTSDCAPLDPSAWSVPSEPARLDVAKASGSEDAVLTWTSLATQAGPGVVYDVVTGRLSELWSAPGADRDFSRATCLDEDRTSPTTTDGRAVGAGGLADGFYYLVRGQNVCGDGTYGDDSGGTPRVISPGDCN